MHGYFYPRSDPTNGKAMHRIVEQNEMHKPFSCMVTS
uniref:Uncharacterized protein n=1 Tax=Arundo donax TaxID=35708 RepID=A0A0A8ZNN8_ARUDO